MLYDRKRFTIDLAWDRAFSDFIHPQSLSGVGPAKGRNQSLTFTLRYAFYERKKKEKSPPK